MYVVWCSHLVTVALVLAPTETARAKKQKYTGPFPSPGTMQGTTVCQEGAKKKNIQREKTQVFLQSRTTSSEMMDRQTGRQTDRSDPCVSAGLCSCHKYLKLGLICSFAEMVVPLQIKTTRSLI